MPKNIKEHAYRVAAADGVFEFLEITGEALDVPRLYELHPHAVGEDGH